MLAAFERQWSAWNGLAAPWPLELGRRSSGRARVRRGPRGDRSLPIQHLHGDPTRREPGRALKSRSSIAIARTSVCRSRISRSKAERLRPKAADPRPHRRPPGLRCRTDRRLLQGESDLSARGLCPCPRRRLERASAGKLRRRGRLLAVRDEDDLHGGGRNPRLRQRGPDRVCEEIPQLRQVRARGRWAQLPNERVHRCPRPGPGGAVG